MGGNGKAAPGVGPIGVADLEAARRDEANRTLIGVALTQLGHVELIVLAQLAQRLCQGQVEFGRFNLATDSRDFFQEATEEAVDCCVYLAAAMIREKQQQGR